MPIEEYSSVLCKFVDFTFIAVEMYSASVLVMFCAERCYAVYKPLQARAVFSERKVKLGLFALFVATIAVSSNSFETAVMADAGGITFCMANFSNAVDVAVFYVCHGIFAYGFPNLFVLLINLAIVARLWRDAKHRADMLRSGHESADANRKQTRATATLVVVAIVHVIVMTPVCVLFTVVICISTNLLQLDSAARACFIQYSYIAYHMGTISKGINATVLFFRVRYFRFRLRHPFAAYREGLPTSSSDSQKCRSFHKYLR